MSLLETLTAEPPPLRRDEGGVIRVGGTRVRLDTIITAFQQGCGVEEIQRKFPSLSRCAECTAGFRAPTRARAPTRRVFDHE